MEFNCSWSDCRSMSVAGREQKAVETSTTSTVIAQNHLSFHALAHFLWNAYSRAPLCDFGSDLNATEIKDVCRWYDSNVNNRSLCCKAFTSQGRKGVASSNTFSKYQLTSSLTRRKGERKSIKKRFFPCKFPDSYACNSRTLPSIATGNEKNAPCHLRL